MRIRYDRQAIAQLDHILAYIARDNPRAAAKTVRYIRQSVRRLTIFPRSGRPGAVKGTRELVAPGTAYIVVYRATDDEIQVLGVFHGAQRR
ncbi:MAG: type II toxin-antitoxin system RelE/ParE family toxin [Kiloniellales bacterium]